jgi:alpha-N-acetylglucosaminidase
MLVLALVCCASALPNTTQYQDPAESSAIDAVRALIGRVYPSGADQFNLELLPSGEAGAMQLSSDSHNVILRGTGGVELASAFNWYLNDYLNVSTDWNTYTAGQLPASKPNNLPLPLTTKIRYRRTPYSWYMNVCTLGYSLAFVPWSYWVKHIDWMAMNGVNLPLAFVGQEWVWSSVFSKFNITFEEQQSFYSGPAFLPWFRMGNIEAFGGALTRNWLNDRHDLQIKILKQMRAFGMKPVLGAFAGHLPDAFEKKYPRSNFTR